MNAAPESERILILDFGSQYGQLIARRVREQNVFCQIVRHDISAERIAELKPRGLIFSGGPASVYAPAAPRCDPRLFDLGIPVLGICYGMQLACHLLGGKVLPADSREFGPAVCHITDADGSVRRRAGRDDRVDEPRRSGAAGATAISCRWPPPTPARWPPSRHRTRPVYGLQFHPEVSHTPQRRPHPAQFPLRRVRLSGIVANRLVSRRRPWRASRERIGDQRVICGLSGGVDSSVTAALLLRAVGRQVVVHLRR